MRLLILGGTVFLGRHIVDAALAAGHHVTIVTRGITQPQLFPNVPHVHLDRDGGLHALPAARWDAIVDTCGFVPRVVAQSAALPSERYVFISSISVYADTSGPTDESAAVLAPVESEDHLVHYGALKGSSERVVLGRAGGVVLRPGLIGGPHDPTGRFTYWPVRLAEGGDVLSPGEPSAPVQVIDARDLAAFAVHLAERGPTGVFNAVGDQTTMGEALHAMREAVGGGARLRWVERPDDVAPWSELPLWVGGDPDHAGTMCVSNTKARAAGLTLRPLADTARDTLAWARTLQGDPPRQVDGRYRVATLTRDREAALLANATAPISDRVVPMPD